MPYMKKLREINLKYAKKWRKTRFFGVYIKKNKHSITECIVYS